MLKYKVCSLAPKRTIILQTSRTERIVRQIAVWRLQYTPKDRVYTTLHAAMKTLIWLPCDLY